MINSVGIVAVFGNKVECCFDKVERCCDVVAGVDGAWQTALCRTTPQCNEQHSVWMNLNCHSLYTRRRAIRKRLETVAIIIAYNNEDTILYFLYYAF